MAAVGKILVAASLTGTLAVGAIAWNGSDNLQVVKSYATSMKEKVVSLASDIGFLNQTVTDKNTQINNQKGRIAELEGTITQLTAERDALQAEVDRLSADNARIPELEVQIQALNTRISELEGQVSDLQASLSSLQADYDNAVAELEKANGEITKANQESQELKDQVATLESESTSTYDSAKVDRTNPMYATDETTPTDPGEFPTLQGKGWNSLVYAIMDNDVKEVTNSMIKTSINQVTYEYNPDLVFELTDIPDYHDGDLDALMDFLVEHSIINNMPSSFNVYFRVLPTYTILVTYNIHIDNATGKYVAERKIN